MLLAILAVWFGYKKGRDSGRNGMLWGFICGATFIGVQLLVGVAAGIGIAIGIAAFGWPESTFDTYQIPITIGAIIPAIAAVLLIFRYLDRIPDEPQVSAPPPPPTFDQGE
ncbi:MAG: hypothetical protein ACKVQJ_14805 [Pyrinomonadaceae bacterium]